MMHPWGDLLAGGSGVTNIVGMRSTARRLRPRFGFGLVEIVILLAVASLIAVLTIPALVQANRLERLQETATILDRTRLAIYDATGTVAFRQVVGHSPGRLSHLIIPIVNGDQNSCGNNYGNPQRNNWPDGGPYGGFNIDPAVGLVTPIGIGNNQLIRNPVGSGGAAGTLSIVFPNVDIEDILLLDAMTDNANGIAAGLIRWAAPAGGLTTFSYTITIDNNC